MDEPLLPELIVNENNEVSVEWIMLATGVEPTAVKARLHWRNFGPATEVWVTVQCGTGGSGVLGYKIQLPADCPKPSQTLLDQNSVVSVGAAAVQSTVNGNNAYATATAYLQMANGQPPVIYDSNGASIFVNEGPAEIYVRFNGGSSGCGRSTAHISYQST